VVEAVSTLNLDLPAIGAQGEPEALILDV